MWYQSRRTSDCEMDASQSGWERRESLKYVHELLNELRAEIREWRVENQAWNACMLSDRRFAKEDKSVDLATSESRSSVVAQNGQLQDLQSEEEKSDLMPYHLDESGDLDLALTRDKGVDVAVGESSSEVAPPIINREESSDLGGSADGELMKEWAEEDRLQDRLVIFSPNFFLCEYINEFAAMCVACNASVCSGIQGGCLKSVVLAMGLQLSREDSELNALGWSKWLGGGVNYSIDKGVLVGVNWDPGGMRIFWSSDGNIGVVNLLSDGEGVSLLVNNAFSNFLLVNNVWKVFGEMSQRHEDIREVFSLPTQFSVVEAATGWAQRVNVTEKGSLSTWVWKQCVLSGKVKDFNVQLKGMCTAALKVLQLMGVVFIVTNSVVKDTVATNKDVLVALSQIIDSDFDTNNVSCWFVKDLVIPEGGEVFSRLELSTKACPIKDVSYSISLKAADVFNNSNACELYHVTHAEPWWASIRYCVHPRKSMITSNQVEENNMAAQFVANSFMLKQSNEELFHTSNYDVSIWGIQRTDEVPFIMQWSQYTDLQVNEMLIMLTNRRGFKLLGINGWANAVVIIAYCKMGLNGVFLLGFDTCVFCVGVGVAGSPFGFIVSMSMDDLQVDNFPVGMCVLAVDDDPTCWKVLEALLSHHNYQDTAANQAIEAVILLNLLLISMACIDLLLLPRCFLLIISGLLLGSCGGLSNDSTPFDQNYFVTWGSNNFLNLDGGKEVQLFMDESSGCGFASKLTYGSGSFRVKMKLPGRNIAGVVTAYYLSSNHQSHDELDCEFLENKEAQPWTLQANVFADSIGNREQRLKLWFDPTRDFHSYGILWNPYQKVFFVDEVPIRVFKNNTRIGVPYTWRPMQIITSLWDSKYLHVQFAIYGKSFNESTGDAWELLQATGIEALIAYDCSNVVLLMGGVMGGLIFGTTAGVWAWYRGRDRVQHGQEVCDDLHSMNERVKQVGLAMKTSFDKELMLLGFISLLLALRVIMVGFTSMLRGMIQFQAGKTHASRIVDDVVRIFTMAVTIEVVAVPAGQLVNLGIVFWMSTYVAQILQSLLLKEPIVIGTQQASHFFIFYLLDNQTGHVGPLYSAFLAMHWVYTIPGVLAALALAYNTNLFGVLTHYNSDQADLNYGATYIDLPDEVSISYCVPQLFQIIYRKNKRVQSSVINFRGFLVGNTIIGDYHDYAGTFEYCWAHGLIYDETYQKLRIVCVLGSSEQPSTDCERAMGISDSEMGNINAYNICTSSCKSGSGSLRNNLKSCYLCMLRSYDPGRESDAIEKSNIFEDSSLHEIANASSEPFFPWKVVASLVCGGVPMALRGELCEAFVGVWTLRMENYYQKLLVSGMNDFGQEFVGFIKEEMSDITMNGTEKGKGRSHVFKLMVPNWLPWSDSGKVGGWCQVYTGLTLATMIGSGHEIPLQRPHQAYITFKSFLQKQPMSTQPF